MIDIYDKEIRYLEFRSEFGIKNKLIDFALILRNLVKENPNSNSPSLINISNNKKNKNKRPAIIIISGGGYFSRDTKIEAIPSSEFFKKIGFNVFILNYRTAPYRYPIAIEDAKRAIRYLRHNFKRFNIDKKRIGVIGFSAGGHIASMVSSNLEINEYPKLDIIDKENSRPDFQILCYPLINLLDNSCRIKVIRNIILDKNIKYYKKSDLDSSLRINQNTPKTFIWHSRKDEVISYRQSEEYSKALTNNCIDHELCIFEDGRHAVGLANQKNLESSDIYNWTKLCEEWLEKNEII